MRAGGDGGGGVVVVVVVVVQTVFKDRCMSGPMHRLTGHSLKKRTTLRQFRRPGSNYRLVPTYGIAQVAKTCFFCCWATVGSADRHAHLEQNSLR